MTTWRFTGYYRNPRERAQRWNWRCTEQGVTKIASLRTFASFSDCLADARRHGYVQHQHLARFDRRYESETVPSAGEHCALHQPADGSRDDRRRND